MLSLLFLTIAPHVLEVGDGKKYPRIEEAMAVAKPHDAVHVYPSADGYMRTAVLVKVPAVEVQAMGHVTIDGGEFDYSGVGSVPRAVFQFEPTAHGSSVQGFEILGAHNASHNGAGVRVNGATNVSVIDCDIHGNDMGVMSNGNGGGGSIKVLSCEIHHNGDAEEAGYNHNLYLGGSSAWISNCSVHDALTGHNLKSRCHTTVISYCRFFGGDNRQMDFVEASETEAPGSDASLIGNVILENPAEGGNRNVIHFGAERGIRNGTLHLVNNTIVTHHVSPVVLLDSPHAAAVLLNNVIVNDEQRHPVLVAVGRGASLSNVSGQCNWISPAYPLEGTRVDPVTRYTTPHPAFASAKVFAIPNQPASWRPNGVVDTVQKRLGADGKWRPVTDRRFLGAG